MESARSRRQLVPGPVGPEHPFAPVGAVFGNVGSGEFRCVLTDTDLRELDHVEVHHPTEGWLLGMISSIELRSDLDREGALDRLSGMGVRTSYERVAKVDVIGRKDVYGNLFRPLTPVLPSTNVYRARQEFIKETLGLFLGRDAGVYMGKLLHTDVDVVLDPALLVQRHVSIIAKSGSGKSYACGVLAEELIRHDIPVVILDLHGEYRSLSAPNLDAKDYERMGRFGVSPKGLADRIVEFTLSPGPDRSDLAPTLGIDIRGFRAEDLLELIGSKNIGAGTSLLYNAMDRAREILADDFDLYDIISSVQAEPNPAKWNILNGLEHLHRLPFFSVPPTPLSDVVSHGKITIIDLKDTPHDIQQIGVAALLKRLFSARKEGSIPPHMLMVEEAHNFCPQNEQAITTQVLRTIASEGRKFGIGLTVVSQRPAKVDKNVLSQCGTQIILKVTNPNDLKAVVASVEGLDTRSSDEIQLLPVSIAVLVGPNIPKPLLVEIRTRSTRHGGRAVDIIGDLRSKYRPGPEDEADKD